MKNELTCAVVRDLLPSFVEGLTAPETNEAVLAHLTACPDCAALRAELSAPEAGEAEAPEVDYLKKVKRRTAGGWRWRSSAPPRRCWRSLPPRSLSSAPLPSRRG